MDAAEGMNLIADAVQKACGDKGFLPLTVRYGAAEAAVRFVAAWWDETNAPDRSKAVGLRPPSGSLAEIVAWVDAIPPREV